MKLHTILCVTLQYRKNWARKPPPDDTHTHNDMNKRAYEKPRMAVVQIAPHAILSTQSSIQRGHRNAETINQDEEDYWLAE